MTYATRTRLIWRLKRAKPRSKEAIRLETRLTDATTQLLKRENDQCKA